MIKTVKLPIVKPRRGPRPKYPFASMKVAASFIVPAGAVSLRSLQAYACARSRALGKKFLVTRIVGKSAYQVYREK